MVARLKLTAQHHQRLVQCGSKHLPWLRVNAGRADYMVVDVEVPNHRITKVTVEGQCGAAGGVGGSKYDLSRDSCGESGSVCRLRNGG